MDTKIQKALEIWHTHFADEQNHYSEFESSDIEYFVGCMLYNHFAFSKALHTMKTMDLSYDFLSSCSDEAYKSVAEIIGSIAFDTEEEKLKFLQEYIQKAKSKYTPEELYLLERLEYHVEAMAQRYEKNVDAVKIDFKNPLFR